MVDILQAIKDGYEVETQSGLEIRIYATDGFGAYSIHAAYRNSMGDWHLHKWDRDGQPYSGNDSLALRVKRRTIELDVWINVYPDGTCSGTYPTRQLADQGAVKNRIARIHIKRTVTEGEGL